MFTLLLLLFFLFMICFPKIVFEGTKSGLMLWFQTVLPTLFPFFLLNTLLLKSRVISYISWLLSPIFCPVFHTSNCSSYAILSGFFCGTPVGAKVIVDLVQDGQVSSEEGEYLLSFCSITSPGFVIGFVFGQCLHRPDLAYISYFILLLSSLLSSFLFRNWYVLPSSSPISKRTIPCKTSTSMPPFEESLQITSEALLKIGGYIMFFCSILFVLQSLPLHHVFWNCFFLPSLELTNGVRQLSAMRIPFSFKYMMLMSLTSFGGFCAAFQTKCIIQKAGFSFRRYLKEKLVTAMVTSLLSFLFIHFLS